MLRTTGLLASLLFVAFVVSVPSGCNKPKPEGKPAPKAKAKEDGWIFGIPEETHHVRLSVDTKTKKALATVLDDKETEEVPIPAESITLNLQEGKGVQITLTAQGEKGKKTAHFSATHDRFGDKVDPKKIEIVAEIEGKSYTFKLEEDEHDHKGKKK